MKIIVVKKNRYGIMIGRLFIGVVVEPKNKINLYDDWSYL